MQVRIQWVYKRKRGKAVAFTSEELKMEEALFLAEDIEKTGRVQNLTFVDEQERSWSVKELKKLSDEVEKEPHDVTVYFDGGFEHGSKQSGLGCAIYYRKNNKAYRRRKNAFVKELNSNNEAEYAALHLALNELELMGVHHMPVIFSGDSQVVINQLTGDWPCLEEELSKWADRVEGKMEKLGIHPDYVLVTRKQNKEADRLATQALEETGIESTIEINEGSSK